MEEEFKLYFSKLNIFNSLPESIQSNIIDFFSDEECFGVDVGDVRCALESGRKFEVFHTVESLCFFLSKHGCSGLVSYKIPLEDIDSLASWFDTFMNSIKEDVVSATMWSFEPTDVSGEFYIVIF